MSVRLKNQASFLRIVPEKERALLEQFRNNILTSIIESENCQTDSDNKPQRSGCCRCSRKRNQQNSSKKTCSSCLENPCCKKFQDFISSIYNIVQSNVGLLLFLIIYACLGALLFSYLESTEDANKRNELSLARRWFLTNMENIFHAASTLLKQYEDYVGKLPAQITKYSTSSVMKEWSFFESLFFCGTVVTTIGYGNVTPVTMYGRIATMIYGCFGIPLCLIFLSKTGKNLTKIIKYFWNVNDEIDDEIVLPYAVDDNFNLPPIVALAIAFVYIFFGAFIYTRWENWDYLESFYFTFISLSTIGFGDVTPDHPKFFLASFVYILMGLSLIAMVGLPIGWLIGWH
ncbi:hypothetical protein HELRODRAFT_76875 [Helobdella robusta]|uniref:Potassium channel domain-containing protein n=1 Tax=Helobdella robusta TaxID=6412 RepID=T1G2Q4_HELRO|nr:hypothetical protein HELRODRAFT_76875 [Helobdella robusta]ESO07020.1 hypothetical protein HELRODRAFT_76875 [Helobdella robusta]